MRMKLEIEKRQQVCVTHRTPKTGLQQRTATLCLKSRNMKAYSMFLCWLTTFIQKLNIYMFESFIPLCKTHLLLLQSELFTMRTKL